MATNLTSVALTDPLATVNIGLTQSFNMEIAGGYSGGGGVSAHDFYWEFDQGTSTWITIPAAGGTLGLNTANTNPLVGKVTTDPESITVVGDKVGSYQIRGKGVRDANTYYTGEITVNVSTLTTAPPTTAAPTTLAPTTVAPTTSAPTTIAPTTLPPTTLAPTTIPPTTLAPTTPSPTTIAPTTVGPTTIAPTTLPPTTLPPTTPAPTTIAPTTLQPTTIGPTTIPGWLDGWDNRLKLTIDHTKVDAELTHFPVTVFLSPTVGSCVFDELLADGNRFKIAFTKTDGFTQLYGEIEKWDDASETAIIHVSRSGWVISNIVDTDFYIYYDIDHADNTTYVGDINSTPGAAVWDSDFKAVHHMIDATTSTLKDSTSNNSDGVKVGANEPNEVSAKVAEGQDFDGGNDKVTVADNAGLNALDGYTNSYTVEFIVKAPSQPATFRIIEKTITGVGAYPFSVQCVAGTTFKFVVYDGTNIPVVESPTAFDSTYKHFACEVDQAVDQLKISLNGGAFTTVENTVASSCANTDDVLIGNRSAGDRGFDGILDEIRISSIARSLAWVKATYNSLWDTLLTYETCTTAPPTTVGPTTIAPTTLPPTTLVPTTAAPTTLSPTTIAPTTPIPTTPSPTTLAPTTIAPTTLAPTTIGPTTVGPTTPKPTTVPPTTLVPTTLPPTTTGPTTIGPTTLAPTTLPPTTIAPTTVGPTTIAPTTEPPTTPIPTTPSPTTVGPTTVAPTTIKPTTPVPTTSIPTTIGPTTIGPTTPVPTTLPPTTLGPTTPPPEVFECIREINSLIAELIIILSLVNEQINLISTISEEVNLRGDICW